MKRVGLIAIFMVFFLSACGRNFAPAATEIPPPSSTPSKTVSPTETEFPPTETLPAPTTTLTPTQEVAIIPRPRYAISATLDYGWRYLYAQQSVAYPNHSADSISELILIVQPNWRTGAFNLLNLTMGDASPAEYTLEGIQLQIPLEQPLQPGEVIDISMDFEITIPPILTSEDFGPNPFGYTTRQMNLTDWHPFFPPYVDEEGWLVHNPWFYGEHLVYPVADYDVAIDVINAPESTVIAASARDMKDGDTHRYQVNMTRNFVWSVSPEYRVFEEQVGETTVLGYAFPFDVVPGEAAFNTTVKSLELYNELFGPYPFDTLTMIEADFEHGMEYQGLYYLSKAFYSTYDGNAGSFLVTIAAHETAHQWWFGLVGNDQALEPWLDEALCTYSELLFYENLDPNSVKWWWDVRVNWYEPEGWIDSPVSETAGYRPYRDAIYLNGAKFFRDLRSMIGDDAFFTFLRDYVTRNAAQIATTDDFFSILSEHTKVNLNWLLETYFQTR